MTNRISFLKSKKLLLSFQTGRGLRKQISNYNKIKDPFFVIGVQGCLHLLDLFLRFVPEDENIILFSSGMDEWELNWAKENLKIKGIVSISTQIKHGNILDYLFTYRKSNFGIMDYDLYIAQPDYFKRLRKIQSSSLGTALFKYDDPNLGLAIPQTHAMFFNTSLVRKLRREYGVKCKNSNYENLSPKIRRSLLQIGVDGTHYPEEKFFKNYFDTTRVLSLLGIANGYYFDFLNTASENDIEKSGVFHVGGVSDPRVTKNRWRVRGSYFWQLVLMNQKDLELRDYYSRLFGVLAPIDELRELLEQDGFTSSSFFTSVDSLIEKISIPNQLQNIISTKR